MNRQELKVKKRFDELAGRFEYHRQATLMRAERIKRHLFRNAVILDVGVGDGGLANLYTSNQKFLGVDFSKKMLKIAKKRLYGCRLLIANGGNLPLKRSKFDFVISSETIYYASDPVVFLKEIHNTLKNNGHVILICRNQMWRKFDGIRKMLNLGRVDDLSYSAYYRHDIEKLLSTAGFKNIKTECFGVLPIKGFEFLDKPPLNRIGHMIYATAVKRTKWR